MRQKCRITFILTLVLALFCLSPSGYGLPVFAGTDVDRSTVVVGNNAKVEADLSEDDLDDLEEEEISKVIRRTPEEEMQDRLQGVWKAVTITRNGESKPPFRETFLTVYSGDHWMETEVAPMAKFRTIYTYKLKGTRVIRTHVELRDTYYGSGDRTDNKDKGKKSAVSIVFDDNMLVTTLKDGTQTRWERVK